QSAERKQGQYLLREQRAGNVFRSIQLPVQIDADKAQANFEHGVLYLSLPKAESTKPRQIRIGGGQTVTQSEQQQLNIGQTTELPVNSKQEKETAGTRN
ncbi:MAG TPA: Hsp20/alpha crystallin family protein, partial [Chloroflexia bacterium]|nr:Hsp20/alpha crystallin family protein [Chloroflexia bacterium]